MLAKMTDRIRRDPRHERFSVLSQGERHERLFANWSMGFSTDTESSLFDWASSHGVPLRLVDADTLAVFLRQQAYRQSRRE